MSQAIAGLYIVSTPIGNLDDITIRALQTLKNSTTILCEDTRVSQKLLTKHNISHPRLQVYNEQSTAKDREAIAQLIDIGEVISLISDAGTPLISDPGYKLVKLLQEKNYHIDVIPGCCSAIAALTISGLPSDRFLFAGFIPKTSVSQHKFFTELSTVRATLICFESAKRLAKSLPVALEVLGNRDVSVVRELTKLYQEVRTQPLAEIAQYYQMHQIKGEVILLISAFEQEADQQTIDSNLEMLIKSLLAEGYSAKDCTDLAYSQFKQSHSKSAIYQLTNSLKN